MILRFIGGFARGGLLGLALVALLSFGGCWLSETSRRAAGRNGPGDAQQESIFFYLFVLGGPIGLIAGGAVGGVRAACGRPDR
jgi:hypothetical protein